MKKYIFPIVLSTLIGSVMAYGLIASYDNLSPITMSKNAKKIYYIQKGEYQTKDEMINEMQEFENYIYQVEDNKYITYVGMSRNKKNAKKIKEYYKQKGYDTNIKEKLTTNTDFLEILNQYDGILNQTTDEGTIQIICNQILSKYEEMIKHEY